MFNTLAVSFATITNVAIWSAIALMIWQGDKGIILRVMYDTGLIQF